jgi:hypothetical protein
MKEPADSFLITANYQNIKPYKTTTVVQLLNFFCKVGQFILQQAQK